MFHNFQEMEDYIRSRTIRKRLVLANAHDDDVLEAVVTARRKGVIEPILIGLEDRIRELLAGMGEKAEDYHIIPCGDEREAARMACRMVKDKEADIPMKGLMQTASFMRAILDKEAYGFVPEGGQLSQATVMEYQGRLMIATDCAVNVAPDYSEKVKIINNAVKLAGKLGIQCPKVAVITPVEVVNPKMQSTIDAAMLSMAARRGQIKNCLVDGPLALDNALSADAARHKGITSQVAGQPDILLMPDLCAGNIFTKSLTYFAHMVSSGTLNGTTVPVVMTSRTDTPEDKYDSILTAIVQGL
ncbi:phosphate acyltransferase [Clostridium sp. 1001271st1 H5]|uniref:phosphate acyltransferase n=2 Tax=unclassified Clostridium TaxID=2614128 RepID=UPI0011059941|nr:phosphate acyltransferase [Clostridium sp. 1001271st1 H5]